MCPGEGLKRSGRVRVSDRAPQISASLSTGRKESEANKQQSRRRGEVTEHEREEKRK
jgi:hypothetical protein